MEYLQYCDRATFVEKELYLFVITEGSIMNTFRASRVVSNYCRSMPRTWRYIAGIIQGTSAVLTTYAQMKAAMFFQTVLRKNENSDEVYIHEAVECVRKHKKLLRNCSRGMTYNLSALVLTISYSFRASVFRRGIS